jgi:predicted DNA-binding protein
VNDVNLECIRPQIEAKLSYVHFEKELADLVKQVECVEKLPVVHVRVEGKDIDRQGVHQALTDALAGKTLAFRQEVVEEAESRLPELKPGSFYVNQVIQDYFKDENLAGLAVEMWKHLRYGDTDEAKKVADEYFQKVKEA